VAPPGETFLQDLLGPVVHRGQALHDLRILEVDGASIASGERIRLRSSGYRLSSAESKVCSTFSKTASPMRLPSVAS